MASPPPTTRDATRASDLSSASAAPLEDESLSADTALLLATSDHSREPARHASPLVVLLFVVLAASAALVVGLLLLDDRDRSPRGVVGPRAAPPSPVASPAPLTVVPPPVAPLPVARTPDPTPSVFVVQSPVPAPPSPEPTPATPAPPLALTPSSGGNGADLLVLGSGWTPGATVALDYLDVDGAQTGSRASAVVDPQGGFGVELLAEDPSDRTGRHVVRVSDGSRTQDVPYEVE